MFIVNFNDVELFSIMLYYSKCIQEKHKEAAPDVLVCLTLLVYKPKILTFVFYCFRNTCQHRGGWHIILFTKVINQSYQYYAVLMLLLC